MNISKISFTPSYKYQINMLNRKKENNSDSATSYTYNPIAYKDFNLSFGERLFRSPSNFYEQEFNKKNMPDTMKKYLFENYEDRQHIPPAQMMKIVFNDINNAEKLEDVKKYFDEPLFENLYTPENKKYREGILAEINIMKEPDKSLFKNGKDDLGMYILKKIYLEGKTLKEINKDFKKDVSVYYEGLSDITYRDIANFGIKFPNNSFWHSFIVTREDFPYISIKKKDAVYHTSKHTDKPTSLSDINNGSIIDKRSPKYKPKDHEIKDITTAIMEDFGDKEKTNKNLKRKLKQNDPKLTFIQKYMSEIMSISLDRVHASDEMRTFFENYENIDKSSRTRLKKYWDNTPEMKALQGLIMSDTIKLFFEYYGADGQNELFTDLINYAHSIKPERERNIELHNEKQKYYDEIAEELSAQIANKEDTENANQTAENNQIHTSSIDGSEFDEKIFKDKFTYNIDGKEFNIYSNLNEELTKCVNMNFDHLLPKAYSDKYAKFLCRTNMVDDKFKLSIIANNSSEDYSLIKDMLYDKESLEEITNRINLKFMSKYRIESRAAHQAFVDTMCKYTPDLRKQLADYIYRATPLDIPVIASNIQSRYKDADDFMNERYNKYLAPLTNQEAKEIATKICKDIIKGYKKENSIYYNKNNSDNTYPTLVEAFSIFYDGEMGNAQKSLRNHLQKFIMKCSGASRALMDDNLPSESKITYTELILNSFFTENEEILYNHFKTDPATNRFLLTV